MTDALNYIAEGLRGLAVPIDDLHTDPANARTNHALDLFAGSGTTLLACERTGRVCRTMDNDPKFVAVCLERWSVATGQQPTLESA